MEVNNTRSILEVFALWKNNTRLCLYVQHFPGVFIAHSLMFIEQHVFVSCFYLSWCWIIHISNHWIVFLGHHALIIMPLVCFQAAVGCIALLYSTLCIYLFLVNITCPKSSVFPNNGWSASRDTLFAFCRARHCSFAVYLSEWTGTCRHVVRQWFRERLIGFCLVEHPFSVLLDHVHLSFVGSQNHNQEWNC